jgi:HSP20 family molecular chaperone IbpA
MVMSNTQLDPKQFDSLFSSKYDNFFSSLFKEASNIFDIDRKYKNSALPTQYIVEFNDNLIVYIEVPGYKKDDININYTVESNLSDVVDVTGTKVDIKNRTIKFYTNFTVSSKYDIKTLEVKHEDGVLKFKVQKRKDAGKVPIKVDIQ